MFVCILYSLQVIVLVLNKHCVICCCREANLQQNLSPASTQVNLEDGTKLKRKRKLQVGEKTVKDNVAKEDEGKKTGVDAVMLDVHVEDKETQEQVGEK